MVPVVRYMILCDDVRSDPERTECTIIDCLMSTIHSLDVPPFPFVRELFCVYLVLTECYGGGTMQIRVSFMDDENEQPLFGSPVRTVDFTRTTPLDLLGITFRIRDGRFSRPGQYSAQLWYNGERIEERLFQVR